MSDTQPGCRTAHAIRSAKVLAVATSNREAQKREPVGAFIARPVATTLLTVAIALAGLFAFSAPDRASAAG
jgi:hypothetical protein